MDSLFIFLFLAIFPFGQIFHLGFNLFGIGITPQPIDMVVGAGALYAIFAKLKKPVIFKYLRNFMLAVLFSFILSIFIFNTPIIVYGFLYLVRLFAYIYFLVYVWNFVKSKAENKKVLLDSLLIVSVVSVVFGWIQFFAVPSIKALFVLGWDEHTFRLVGTFLDPTFLALIIVFGLMITIYRYIVRQSWKNILVTIFLLISLAFTYSRASYLAFLAGIIYLGFVTKKWKYIILSAIILISIISILPTTKNPSIGLIRPSTNIAKISNYQETLQIIQKFPVFGVGFNNMCLARNKFIGSESYFSHSCSGSDSSILFILATTGVVGLIIFNFGAYRIYKKVSGGEAVPPGRWNIILISSVIALLVHSLFSNSLFYPWIMGYLVILLATAITERSLK